MKQFIFGLLMLMIGRQAFAQTAPDTASIIKNMGYYDHKLSPDILFAHFDKTIYTNNENVWFTAYLLNGADRTKNMILSVVMMNDDEHTMVLEKKFVMAKGIAFGNLLIPDTLLSGNYTFLLYTNHIVNGRPADVFRQPVTIKNTRGASFTAFLNLLDTATNQSTGDRRVLLLTHGKDAQLTAGATVEYRLGDKQHTTVLGKGLTDKAGQYQFTIPVKNISNTNNRLHAKITYHKDVQLASLPLPTLPSQPIVKFYPEGGNLANNVLCNVGWEAKSTTGDVYRLKALLLANNTVLDTIETNSYGMGRFWLQPQKGVNYSVKLLHVGKDTAYNLPVGINNIASITLLKSVCDDTLKAAIRTDAPRKIYAVLHNYRQTFGIQPLQLTSNGMLVKMTLENVPKGVIAITLLNDQLQPFAERLFFAHYDHRTSPLISTDAESYSKRQKVTLKLRLPATGNNNLSGLVSVACVQSGLLESLKQTNIESYLYLEHELNILPADKFLFQLSAKDSGRLEDLLLIKGWRRYVWTEMMKSQPTDTTGKVDEISFSGTVSRKNKNLDKSRDIVLRKNNLLKIIEVDKTGTFRLKDSDLYVTDDKKVYMQLSGNDGITYKVDLKDPFTKVNDTLAAKFVPANYGFAGKVINEPDNQLDFKHSTLLREVKVTDKSNENDYHANACGDYVCRFNILNCPNHRYEADNRPAVQGEQYLTRGANFNENTYSNFSLQRYEGCSLQTNVRNEFNGINYAMEFYGSDYSSINPSTPDYSTTIYWKHLCKISSTADTELTFYTSDVTGNFKIVVQGIIRGDVIYGEKTIQVVNGTPVDNHN